jgi:hypothetical protein
MLGAVALTEPLSYTALVGDCSCRRSSDLDLTASANPRGVFFGAHDFPLKIFLQTCCTSYNACDTIATCTGDFLMSSPKSFDTHMTLRVTGRVRTAFNRKAERYGKPSDVLRELIEAFLDDRLVIKPNPRKESLYVPRIQD